MPTKETKLTRRRLRTSYFTSTISISLVLFVVGLMGILLLNAKRLSDYVRENIGITIYLKEQVKEADVMRLQKILDAEPYVKSTDFVSKKEAAQILQKDLGEDFVRFLGYNPLSASIDVKLYAQYANPDSLNSIVSKFQKNPLVSEIQYQKSLVEKIHNNIQKLSLILLGVTAILFIIAFTLINNTIRLSVYTKRFLINTMQLVGAKRGFIRRPFVMKAILQGVYSAIIAILLLMGIIYVLKTELYNIINFQNIMFVGVLFTGVMLFGIFISWISTVFAVNKFLRMSTQDLYYYH